jgi:Family of unknown function (DUF6529)
VDVVRRPSSSLLVPLVIGLAVAGAIYAFGTSHTPDYSGTGLFGRSAVDTLPLKSWLASAALAVALFQLTTALWMYRKIPLAPRPPHRIGLVHRLSGATAVLITVPVAYHCMFAYGIQTFDARVAVHSAAGAFLYGALAAKLVIVHWKRLPGWTLPLAGGLLVAGVVLLWYTSALWYFNDSQLPL